MVDVVKTIVAERNGLDLSEDFAEVRPASDFLSGKGISFEGSQDFLLQKVGGLICGTIPDFSTKATYSGETVTALEVFNGSTQTTPNRLARGDFSYTGDILIEEVWKVYSTSDGTTVLATTTVTHSYSGNNYTGSLTEQT